MPKLVKDGAIVECGREFLPKDTNLEAAIAKAATAVAPLALWLAHKEALLNAGLKAVWLDSDEQAQALAADLPLLELVAVNFPTFMDGRGFSTARQLREHHGFSGELRAIGYLIQDQMHFLMRCGFNAMALRDGTDLESALASLADFSEHYQAAVDEPKPLFLRRA